MAMRFTRPWDFNPGNKQLDLNSLTQDTEVLAALNLAIGLAGALTAEDIDAVVDPKVAAAVAALVAAAPSTLDTLNELAAALGDDPNFATTMTAALGDKVNIEGSITGIAGPMTQAAYDAIVTPDPALLYVIVG
jgi:hypothetical protein